MNCFPYYIMHITYDFRTKLEVTVVIKRNRKAPFKMLSNAFVDTANIQVSQEDS